VERVTTKPVTFKFVGRGCLTLGGGGFGRKGFNGPGLKFAAIVTFHDQLTAEELAAVQDSIEATGQAYRDKVYIVQPAEPRGRWKLGRPGFGKELFGPEV
jgi:hypothetical protein